MVKAYRGLCEFSDIVPKIQKYQKILFGWNIRRGHNFKSNGWKKIRNNLKAITYMTSKAFRIITNSV